MNTLKEKYIACITVIYTNSMVIEPGGLTPYPQWLSNNPYPEPN